MHPIPSHPSPYSLSTRVASQARRTHAITYTPTQPPKTHSQHRLSQARKRRAPAQHRGRGGGPLDLAKLGLKGGRAGVLVDLDRVAIVALESLQLGRSLLALRAIPREVGNGARALHIELLPGDAETDLDWRDLGCCEAFPWQKYLVSLLCLIYFSLALSKVLNLPQRIVTFGVGRGYLHPARLWSLSVDPALWWR